MLGLAIMIVGLYSFLWRMSHDIEEIERVVKRLEKFCKPTTPEDGGKGGAN